LDPNQQYHAVQPQYVMAAGPGQVQQQVVYVNPQNQAQHVLVPMSTATTGHFQVQMQPTAQVQVQLQGQPVQAQQTQLVHAAPAAAPTAAPAAAAPATASSPSTTTEKRLSMKEKTAAQIAQENQEKDCTDCKDRFGAIVNLSIQTFNLVMACLLTVWVPQNCGGRTCELIENVQGKYMTQFDTGVLVWNFLTLAAVLIHEALVWRRENFLIEYFDESDVVDPEALEKVLPEYPEIATGFKEQNKIVMVTALFSIAMVITNIILSAYVILSKMNGTRSVTVFITNTLLLVAVFRGVIYSTYMGYTKGRAQSLTKTAPFHYNLIDHKYVVTKRRAPPTSSTTTTNAASPTATPASVAASPSSSASTPSVHEQPAVRHTEAPATTHTAHATPAVVAAHH
jgi:hypothetical protein